jgi:hypothetical protein
VTIWTVHLGNRAGRSCTAGMTIPNGQLDNLARASERATVWVFSMGGQEAARSVPRCTFPIPRGSQEAVGARPFPGARTELRQHGRWGAVGEKRLLSCAAVGTAHLGNHAWTVPEAVCAHPCPGASRLSLKNNLWLDQAGRGSPICLFRTAV